MATDLGRVFGKFSRLAHGYSREQRYLRRWQLSMKRILRDRVREQKERRFGRYGEEILSGARQVYFTPNDVLLMERISLRWWNWNGHGEEVTFYPYRVWKRIKKMSSMKYFKGSLLLKVIGEVLGFKNLTIKLALTPFRWTARKWHEAEKRFDVWLDT